MNEVMVFTKLPGWIWPTLPIIAFIIVYNIKRRKIVRLIDRIPGLPSLPFIGNIIEVNVEHDEIFSRMSATRMLWGRRSGLCKAWYGTQPYVFFSKASAVEVILGSSCHTYKSDEYRFLHPWLGQGLLTSSGPKWHSRRKILTGTFHFKILEDFLGVFIEQSEVLNGKLSENLGRGAFNVLPYITNCTLDIICETAMGMQVKAQSGDSEYVEAVHRMGSIVQERQSKFWLQPSFLFKLSSLYKEHKKCLKVLHSFSKNVIRERKAEMRQSDWSREDDFGLKKRLAFLDLLLTASEDGRVLNDDDVLEEVNTFIFEGHDTTAAAISWLLYLLGCYVDIQEKVYEELNLIFNGDERPPTYKDLADMKYLEACIKEALRLYPSVPIFARKLHSDAQIDEYVIPSGTTAMIVAYQLHRDPEQFPDPELFLPERFIGRNPTRHPYAYIPFSAGPRNCIGQKFAVIEEKVVVSSILRKFKIQSVDRREDLVLLGELILRPKNGLNLIIQSRNKK